MSSKRSAAESDRELTNMSTQRNKKRKVPFSEGATYSLDRGLRPSDSAHLSILKTLVREVVDDPSILSTELDVTKAADIAKAASALNDAFQHSNVDSLPSHDFSRAMMKHSSSNFSQKPALPQILDKQMEKAVFTHPSAEKAFGQNYDRLEVMGDAYIELIATRLIWVKYPNIPAGRMSQIREILVKNETLAECSQLYGFDRRASIPKTYLDQPKRRTKILGDIFEAYVAAIILSNSSGGFQIAEEWLTELWLPKLINVTEKSPHKYELHSKQELAAKVLMKGVKLDYLEERPFKQNNDGTQLHFIGVYLTGYGWNKKHLGSGQGLNKAEAGEEAASNAFANTSLMLEVTNKKSASMAK
ncbi:hypothetical protein N7495_000666 [Penicillium taxi]|uniref:uncharacterized protein n=1 Tax=Penicillium taxi TaxID=168475 RepID=UPI002545A408|nr:uncharacterized protein N7495_000666 [Penicillium taxi]KAJ5907984.1 hypothetical protein N7495_000666 [Penicillium taxi]